MRRIDQQKHSTAENAGLPRKVLVKQLRETMDWSISDGTIAFLIKVLQQASSSTKSEVPAQVLLRY